MRTRHARLAGWTGDRTTAFHGVPQIADEFDQVPALTLIATIGGRDRIACQRYRHYASNAVNYRRRFMGPVNERVVPRKT